MPGKHINGDRRLYLVKDEPIEPKRADIIIGGFKLVFDPAKNAWVTLGGGVIKIRAQAEQYAQKISNYMTGLSV